MKRLSLVLAVILTAFAPVAITGCSNAPSNQVVAGKTLLAIGESVDTSMTIAAGLLRDGKISVSEWQKIAAFHDTKFQPSFNLAVAAVSANLDSFASPDLIALAAQLAALVASFQTTK